MFDFIYRFLHRNPVVRIPLTTICGGHPGIYLSQRRAEINREISRVHEESQNNTSRKFERRLYKLHRERDAIDNY